jgi:formiminotetrahydrofolate cyclodeaminase
MTDAIDHVPSVARFGNRAAISDIRVALELLEASSAGAAANVEINLTGLDDEAFRKSVAADVLTLTNRVKEHTANARAALVDGAVAG